MGDLRGEGAVGGVDIDDLGNDGNVARRDVDGRDASGGESDSDGELHFVGLGIKLEGA